MKFAGTRHMPLQGQRSTLLEGPAHDEVEVTLFGPGKGESCLVHLGGGRWLIVDSCRDQTTKDVPALAYLKGIGVDIATQVELIVATHAHDDHFAGIADIFQAASSATFILSNALTGDEFFALMDVDRIRQQLNPPKLRVSAYEEYRRVNEIADARFQANGGIVPMRRATQGLALLDINQQGRNPAVSVWALSPSEEATTRALRKIANSLPLVGGGKNGSTVDPNECSIALRIHVGDISVLLGADLPVGPEGCGWKAVLATPKPFKATLLKVPHHGSPTAHHPDVWGELLVNDPVALVAPFRAGRRPIPDSTDRARILRFTQHLYQTARTELPASRNSVRRTAATLRDVARNVREPWGQVGRITARRHVGAQEWAVTTAPPAHRVT